MFCRALAASGRDGHLRLWSSWRKAAQNGLTTTHNNTTKLTQQQQQQLGPSEMRILLLAELVWAARVPTRFQIERLPVKQSVDMISALSLLIMNVEGRQKKGKEKRGKWKTCLFNPWLLHWRTICSFVFLSSSLKPHLLFSCTWCNRAWWGLPCYIQAENISNHINNILLYIVLNFTWYILYSKKRQPHSKSALNKYRFI